jgi:hypothetical protein
LTLPQNLLLRIHFLFIIKPEHSQFLDILVSLFSNHMAL